MIKIKQLYLWLIVLSATITYGINFFHSDNIFYYNTYIQRQFGNAVTINAFTLLLLSGLILFPRWQSKNIKNIFSGLLIFSCISLIIPNKQDLQLSVIGIYALLKYCIFFCIITSVYSLELYKEYIGQGFKIALLFETIGGILQVFYSIKIPFITSWSTDSIRSGLPRMAGTFSSGPDLALFISFLLVYFWIEYLLRGRKEMLKYILISLFDLWFAGSRTMIVVSALVYLIILLQKYKRNCPKKIIIFLGILITASMFTTTSLFRMLFIENNIFDMLSTRLVHWVMAFNIIKNNWFLGVGLNNSVSYTLLNPDLVKNAYVNSLEGIGFYFTNPIHNSILIMFCELGILGGTIYLFIYIKMMITSLKAILKRKVNNMSYDLADYMFVLCESLVLFVYALQGWGVLKEYAWIMIILVYAYFYMITINKSNEVK